MPYTNIETEYNVGNNLFLDIFVPVYDLGIEYHGRQHFEFVEHFHGDLRGFEKSKERDRQKVIQCEQRGIVLVVFTYDDELTQELIYSRIVDEITNQPQSERQPEETVLTWHELMAQKRRQRNKQAYQRAKELRDDRNRRDRPY